MAFDRLDALCRVFRPLHQRQGQDRRHRRYRGRRREAGLPEALERVLGELELPDSDSVGSGRAIGVEIVRERLVDRCDLRDRDSGAHRPARLFMRWRNGGSSRRFATSVPEPAPRPGPGWVLAPICQSRRTGVACPGLAANGRQSRFWSSASAPEYGSPWWRLMFATCRSAGDRPTRLRMADSGFGACATIRAWIRSA